MFSLCDTQNLQHFLFYRESGFNPYGRIRPVSQLHEHYQRIIYKCIVPKLSIQDVEKPPVSLRHFTPDGELLLTISNDQTTVNVFKYQGVGAALNLLSKQKGNLISSSDASFTCISIRQKIFDTLFKNIYSVRLVRYDAARRSAKIHREFSMFIQDGQFVLLATLRDSPPEDPSDFNRLIQYPDIWVENERVNYTFFLIHLKNGKITDTIRYVDDNIKLVRNQGVSIWQTTVAILSTTRQCIDVYEFESSGKLILLKRLGMLDRYLFREQLDSTLIYEVPFNLPLSPLKQNILAYMYKNILEIKSLRRRNRELKAFYENFPHVDRMLMTKMQLIDLDHLLIRYENRPQQVAEVFHIGEANINKKLFPLYVIYNARLNTILRTFEKNSLELLRIQRDFSDNLRNVRSLHMQRFPSSPSNNYNCRAVFDSAITAFQRGITEDTARLNSVLPIPSQSFSFSPYLDLSLFRYDENFVSSLQRAALFPENPICFYDATNDRLKFVVQLQSIHSETNNSRLRPSELVVFLFHPHDPLIISVQKYRTRYVINVHIYN